MKQPQARAGVTLMELLTAIVIIAILAAMSAPLYERIRNRMELAKCTSNLRALHTAASSYVTEHKQWPQIDASESHLPPYALNWLAALQPYGIERTNWVCPTLQRQFGDPDLKDDTTFRTDYIAVPMDPKEFTPRRFSKLPWFAERADVHGNGNLILFPDGAVIALKDYIKDQ